MYHSNASEVLMSKLPTHLKEGNNHRESKKGKNGSLLVSASWLLWCWTSVHTYKEDQCNMKNKRGGPETEGRSLMPPIPQLFWPICCVNYSDSRSFWTETSCNFEVTERSVSNINNFYYRASWPPNEIALFLTTTKSGLLEKYWHWYVHMCTY